MQQLSVAHLSDPHVTSGVRGVAPATALGRALERVLGLDPQPRCVVITGDLVDHGDPQEYALLVEVLARFPLPLHLAPGNHDARAALAAAVPGLTLGPVRPLPLAAHGPDPGTGTGTGTAADEQPLAYVADHPGLTVVMLDSLVPGKPYGLLGPDQLAWLDRTLAQRPDVPALVCLHHPPIAHGTPYLDAMRLADGPELAEVVARHPQVARVLSGHVHRSTAALFAGTLAFSAPSTYRQSGLGLADERPVGHTYEPTGFLLHVRAEDGWVTHTVPVSHGAGISQHY